MNADFTVYDLIARWEESKERGQPMALEELCRERPDLLMNPNH